MNTLINIIVIVTLTICAVFIWIACAALGILISFDNTLAPIHYVAQVIGLIGVISIIQFGRRILG